MLVHHLYVVDDRAIQTIEFIGDGVVFIKRVFPESLKVQYVAKGKRHTAALFFGCITKYIGNASCRPLSNVLVSGLGDIGVDDPRLGIVGF